MSDNEKLIEEAAKAIYETRDDAYDLDAWEQLDRTQQERYVCDARTALAVFEKAHEKYLEREDAEYGSVIEQLEAVEKAHTPTSDEREALARLVFPIPPDATPGAFAYGVADRAILSGFRRSVVPEPSAEEWTHCSPALLAYGLNCASTPRRACACEPANGGHDHLTPEPSALPMSLADDPLRAPFQKKRTEPQGEPSDEQIDAVAEVIDQHSQMTGSDYCQCGATWSPAHLAAALLGDTSEFGVFEAGPSEAQSTEPKVVGQEGEQR